MPDVKNHAKTISELIQNADTDKQRATIIAAEQITIAYYYDMMAIMTTASVTGQLPKTLPPQESIQKAITELNRACANQHRPYMFNGKLSRLDDRFLFAAGVAAS